MIVTPSDCAGCLVQPHCSAWFVDGEWEHDSGQSPCKVIFECKHIQKDQEWMEQPFCNHPKTLGACDFCKDNVMAGLCPLAKVVL